MKTKKQNEAEGKENKKSRIPDKTFKLKRILAYKVNYPVLLVQDVQIDPARRRVTLVRVVDPHVLHCGWSSPGSINRSICSINLQVQSFYKFNQSTSSIILYVQSIYKFNHSICSINLQVQSFYKFNRSLRSINLFYKKI